MIKLSFLKRLKGMPTDVAKVLIAHKGYSIGVYNENRLSLNPQKNTILLCQKDNKILFAKAADVLELE